MAEQRHEPSSDYPQHLQIKPSNFLNPVCTPYIISNIYPFIDEEVSISLL